MAIIYDFINSVLVFLYGVTGNLGLTIIAFTAIVRTLLLPLTIPSLRSQKQMQQMQPELKVLKQKHGKDQKAYQAAQLELYKKYNMNPIAGCVPQLVQLGLLIVLYHALTVFLKQSEVNGQLINTTFLWLNLSQVDSRYIIPVLAGLTQFILSMMIAPATEIKDIVPNNSAQKSVQAENKKEEDVADMAATMQQQMLFVMPVMTGIFAANFPSGLGLYWIATTVFSLVQQYFISGPGGLVSYVRRAYLVILARMGRPVVWPDATNQADTDTVKSKKMITLPSSKVSDLAAALSSKSATKKVSKGSKPASLPTKKLHKTGRKKTKPTKRKK